MTIKLIIYRKHQTFGKKSMYNVSNIQSDISIDGRETVPLDYSGKVDTSNASDHPLEFS